MLRQLTALAALAAATLTAGGAPALADEPIVGCYFHSVQVPEWYGSRHVGLLWGHAAHAGGGGSLSLRCFVTVNGWEVTDDGLGITGQRLVDDPPGLTYRVLTFTASETDVVQVCGQVTTSHGTTTWCNEDQHYRVPPEPVNDLVAALMDQAYRLVDPVVCGSLRLIGGMGFNVLGLVRIEASGDAYLAGELIADC